MRLQEVSSVHWTAALWTSLITGVVFQVLLDDATESWGIKVERVEMYSFAESKFSHFHNAITRYRLSIINFRLHRKYE